MVKAQKMLMIGWQIIFLASANNRLHRDRFSAASRLLIGALTGRYQINALTHFCPEAGDLYNSSLPHCLSAKE